MSDNTPGHTTVKKDGYEITFHPAFSSRCTIKGSGADGSETELYKQKDKHVFKNGEKHPKKHVFKIKGGKHGRDLEMEIKDPRHHVARIIVEFYADGHEPGSTMKAESVEVVEVDNFSKTCPPDC